MSQTHKKQKSVVDGTDVEELRERIKQYYTQMTKGCENYFCENKKACGRAMGKFLTKQEAIVKAFDLVKQFPTESLVCEDILKKTHSENTIKRMKNDSRSAFNLMDLPDLLNEYEAEDRKY